MKTLKEEIADIQFKLSTKLRNKKVIATMSNPFFKRGDEGTILDLDLDYGFVTIFINGERVDCSFNEVELKGVK